MTRFCSVLLMLLLPAVAAAQVDYVSVPTTQPQPAVAPVGHTIAADGSIRNLYIVVDRAVAIDPAIGAEYERADGFGVRLIASGYAPMRDHPYWVGECLAVRGACPAIGAPVVVTNFDRLRRVSPPVDDVAVAGIIDDAERVIREASAARP